MTEQAWIIPLALAEYFDCSPDELGAWAVVCERQGPEVHSIWAAAPHWLLLGLCAELQQHLETLRSSAASVNASRNGEAL